MCANLIFTWFIDGNCKSLIVGSYLLKNVSKRHFGCCQNNAYIILTLSKMGEGRSALLLLSREHLELTFPLLRGLTTNGQVNRALGVLELESLASPWACTINIFPTVIAGICADQIQPYCFTIVTIGICNSLICM